MQTVTFKKGVDNKKDFNKFKLVAGENYKTVFDLGHQTGAEILEIMGQNALQHEYDKFISEAEELIEKNHSNGEVDGDGNLVLTSKPDLSSLKEKYKNAIKQFDATNILIKEFLDTEIDIELVKFDLEKIPVNISGSYLHCIKSMINVN